MNVLKAAYAHFTMVHFQKKKKSSFLLCELHLNLKIIFFNDSIFGLNDGGSLHRDGEALGRNELGDQESHL